MFGLLCISHFTSVFSSLLKSFNLILSHFPFLPPILSTQYISPPCILDQFLFPLSLIIYFCHFTIFLYYFSFVFNLLTHIFHAFCAQHFTSVFVYHLLITFFNFFCNLLSFFSDGLITRKDE